jgi:anaerobic dimethyl sulfoxide reductase subunit C (anchor subunit)
MLKEWPLVAFTILGQTAVGLGLFVLLPVCLSGGFRGSGPSREALFPALALILGLLVAASALSFFHLRHPLRARRVLANFRTSWLSREIFFELALMGLLALAFVLVWTENGAGLFFRLVAGAAVLAGISFLVSMSKLYMLETLAPWKTASTMISFSLTALTLGAIAAAWIVRSAAGDRASGLPGLLGASLLFIAVDIFTAALLTPFYGALASRPEPTLRPPARTLRLLHLGRVTLLALASVLLALSVLPDGLGASVTPGSGPVLSAAFVLVLAAEVAGRFLFYGLVPRPGD